MKRPLIVIEQENLIMCDNINCDYVIPKESDDPYESIDKYLNMPCPKCRHNLLTEDDLNRYKQATSIVKFINKWFGWLSIFSSKKTDRCSLLILTNEIRTPQIVLYIKQTCWDSCVSKFNSFHCVINLLLWNQLLNQIISLKKLL